MHVFLSALIAVFFLLGSSVSAQEVTPISISLYDAIAIPQARTVKGLSLNLIYGKHEYVSGVDIGLISHTLYKNTGVLVAGVQIGHKSSGVRLALFNFVDEASGFQMGLMNFNKFGNCPSFGVFYNDAAIKSAGPQMGIWNSSGELLGIQLGVINYATESEGMQFGLINVSDTMSAGIQFGLLNFSNSGFFPVLKL